MPCGRDGWSGAGDADLVGHVGAEADPFVGRLPGDGDDGVEVGQGGEAGHGQGKAEGRFHNRPPEIRSDGPLPFTELEIAELQPFQLLLLLLIFILLSDPPFRPPVSEARASAALPGR